MKTERFMMRDLRCGICEREFTNHSILLRLSDGDCYCYDCMGKAFQEDLKGDEPRDFTPYRVYNGVAHLAIMDAKIYCELEDGVYGMCFYEDEDQGEGNNIFVFDSIQKEIRVLRDYVEHTLRWLYVIEKNSSFSCLLFPANKVVDEIKFVDKCLNGTRIIDQFCKITNTDVENINYIVDSYNNVIGIITDSREFGKSKVIIECFDESLTLKTTPEIIEEYMKTLRDDKEGDIDSADSTVSKDELKTKAGMMRHVSKILKELTPQKMLKYCEDRIFGQGIEIKKAVYLVYSYLQSVASGAPFHADNWILTSPSGTGKTEFYRVIRDVFKMYNIPIPVAQIDLSQITEVGFKGSNSNTITDRLAAMNPSMGGYAICFLDEADKKFIPSYGSRGVDYNAAVQSNLLTMLEGINLTANVNDEDVPFDTSKTMFVLLGSFQQLRDDKQKKSLAKGRIGFGDDYGEKDEEEVAADAMYDALSIDDMIGFGMQEEIAGRITYVINFHKLSEDDMRNLIRKKAHEISETMNVRIYITEEAVEDFLKISFGNLGVRAPMNQIKKLVQEKIAEVFFEDGFDETKQRIVIDSADKAHAERMDDAPKQTLEKSKKKELS